MTVVCRDQNNIIFTYVVLLCFQHLEFTKITNQAPVINFGVFVWFPLYAVFFSVSDGKKLSQVFDYFWPFEAQVCQKLFVESDIKGICLPKLFLETYFHLWWCFMWKSHINFANHQIWFTSQMQTFSVMER